nr:hypothetical protein CFP56_78793 [Quercus suber]
MVDPAGPGADGGDELGAGGDDELTAVAGQDLLDDGVGDDLGVDDLLLRGLKVLLERRDHGGGGEGGVHDGGPDLRGLVDGAQLVGEAFVESHGGGLGAGVGGHELRGDEGGDRGDGDDLALLRLHHGGEEGLDGEPVCHGVDVVDLLELVRLGLEDGAGGGDTGVVDEDGGVAVFALDGLLQLEDGVAVGDVALVVVDLGEGLHVGRHVIAHIDGDDGEASGGEVLADATAEATGSAGEQDDLVLPDVAGALVGQAEVVAGQTGQVAVDAGDDAEAEEPLEGDDALVDGGIGGIFTELGEERLAELGWGEGGGEEEGAGDGRVEEDGGHDGRRTLAVGRD